MFAGCYAETMVHKEKTAGDFLKKASLLFLAVFTAVATVICLLASLIAFAMALFVVFCIFGFLAYYYIPRFNIDWEYVFVDGQLDFDQILGGNGRKRKLRIDFEDVEMVAKTGSHHLDEYKNVNRVLDYSSLSGSPNYTIIYRQGTTVAKILFEPDENMVNTMRNKSPRKVKKD